MDLNVPATSRHNMAPEQRPATPPQDPSRPSAAGVAEALVRKYGPMPISENARTVLNAATQEGDEGGPAGNPEEMACRVAYNIALAEGLYYGASRSGARWAEAFYVMMLRLDFLPTPHADERGPRAPATVGCFVLPVEDSMESIFEAVKNTALIHKSGGGTASPSPACARTRRRPLDEGSLLRPDLLHDRVRRGHRDDQAGRDPAAPTWNPAGRPPDILDFITCKSQTNRLNNFNISVALTEEFMKAVESGRSTAWSTRTPGGHGAPPGREVFERIVDSSWKNGERG